MASSPITSCQIEVEKVEAVTDFIFLGSKITVDGGYSHRIKRCFFSWKESYDKLRQHIKKQRHHFANKVCVVKAMVFPVVIYRYECWTVKKAHRLINAFKLWC